MSLPLELKLDVAVLLAARATFRKNIPQQVWTFTSVCFYGMFRGPWRAEHTFSAEVYPWVT